ncbi:MAG: hypothetical protein KDD36_09230 [Flavobacteriales bacterium]|nr:hypothetical protein [Flavobacteriales bacterium]
MGQDIFNNHGAYSRFMALSGLRITEAAPVTPYLLECELKRTLAEASDTTLEKVAKEIYGKVGLLSANNVRDHLNVSIESLGQEELQTALSLKDDQGSEVCLLYIIRL